MAIRLTVIRRYVALSMALSIGLSPVLADSAPPADRFTKVLTEDVRALSFTSHKQVLHAVRDDGGPAGKVEPADLSRLHTLDRVVLLVHGSQYDPERTGLLNPYSTFAHVVRSHLDPSVTAVSFGWYSAPFSVKNQLIAWFRGSLMVYGLARKSLESQLQPLDALIRALPPTWSAICHSVGCELIRRTLDADSSLPRPRRMLLLSGDLREDLLDQFAATNHVQVLAVRSWRDLPLARSHFRKSSGPYWTGERQRTSQWTDLMFSPDLLEKGGRWSFRYSRRRRFWDHMATFEFAEPWSTYNQFLLSGPPVAPAAASALRHREP